jgi:precorrin-2 dehydrogenase/sirohydrochlorin ferrochelatase
MKYYPMYVDLKNKKCIIIGGGEVAERKVESLLECRADVTVISPQLTERLQRLALARAIKYLRRNYRRGDLEGAFLVVSATNNSDLNAIVCYEAHQKNILVNIVDDPKKCSFIVPSVVERGDLLISISTSGSCPALAKKIRRELEKKYGEEYVDYLKLLQEARDMIKQKYESAEERRLSLNRVLDLDILPLLKEGKKDLVVKKVRECI